MDKPDQLGSSPDATQVQPDVPSLIPERATEVAAGDDMAARQRQVPSRMLIWSTMNPRWLRRSAPQAVCIGERQGCGKAVAADHRADHVWQVDGGFVAVHRGVRCGQNVAGRATQQGEVRSDAGRDLKGVTVDQ